MADVAGIWDIHAFSIARRDKVKRVTPDILVGDRLLDLRHVARDALVSGTARLVVGMLLNRRRVRTRLRIRTMAIEISRSGSPHAGIAVLRMPLRM
jgi:hypothetical protein